MKKYLFFALNLSSALVLSAQSNVATWDFNSNPSDASTATGTTTPSTGTASISLIGGTTSTYASGYVADPNLSDNSGLNISTWPAQGTNPKTAGIQFDVNTVGFNRIGVEFWQRLSNTAPNTWVLQYTTDKTGTSTGGTVIWTDATTYTFTPQATGTGDTWYFRSFSFATIGAISNNANAAFRVVSDFDPVSGTYLSARSTSTYGTSGTSRFDLVRIFETAPDVSIAAANNFAQYSENIGSINVPITVANANQAPVNLTFSLSSYSNASEGTDFTWTNSFSIPANQNGVFNFPLTIIDDTVAEKAERLILKINSGANSNPSLTNNYQIIFIKDNDYVAPAPTNELNLNFLTSFSNGATGTNSAEIVAFDPTVDRLYIVNSIGQKLDIINFANPSAPVLLSSIPLATYGNINSVVVRNGVVAMAIESIPAQNNGKVVFLDASGNYVNQVTVGAMPDMITFNKDYTKLLTANEGEPNADYSIDPEGSVSIIDLGPGIANLTNANVTTVGFTSFNGQEATLRAQGIRIFSSSLTVAQDLEPEYITISEDNTQAYVTLQENNALLTINLTNNTITSLSPLGLISYAAGSGNALDASDQSGAVLITGDLPIKGVYMPDAITQVTIAGQSYLLTANEGDSREFGSVVDANRISSTVFNSLDATAFPDQAILRNNKFLGRLSALKYSGDTDGDGDYDELHVMGGRSFSIWNATTGALVFDSKDLFEQITSQHPQFGAIFNASNSAGTPVSKNRSDDKGPEPEGIVVQQFDGSTYAFISLERIGGVMVFNINNPANPVYVGYYNNRSTSVSGPDLGAEGIITIPAADSPNGNDLVILANEVSSTLSIYQMQTCAQASGAVISSADNTICPGQNTTLNIPGSVSSTYQWYKDNQIIPSATTTSITVNTPGSYKVSVTNANLGCTDESINFTVTSNPVPNVNAGNDQTVCAGTQVTLSASGANTYAWSNGVNTSSLTVSTVNSTYSNVYTVTGTDAITGCSASDQVTVNVNALPNVNAGNDITACENNTITLNANGASSYIWGAGVTNGVAFNLNPGTYSYTVTGTDNNGCVNSDSLTVVVNPAPTVSAGSDIEVCFSELPEVLNASANQQQTQFVWNGNQSGAQFNATATGTYIVVGTNSFGCSDSDSVNLTVFENTTVDAGDFVSVCSNELPATLTANTSAPVNTYNWNTGASSSAIIVNQSGIYEVSVTDLNGCTSTDQVELSVLTSPSVNAGFDQVVCESEFPVTLNATGSGGSVLWSTGSQSPFTTVSSAGIYIVTVTSNNGCIVSDTVEVILESCANVNDLLTTISLYPNPTFNEIHLNSSSAMNGAYKLFANDGKLVLEEKLSGENTFRINLSQYAEGIYVLRLELDYGTKDFRIVKQ